MQVLEIVVHSSDIWTLINDNWYLTADDTETTTRFINSITHCHLRCRRYRSGISLLLLVQIFFNLYTLHSNFVRPTTPGSIHKKFSYCYSCVVLVISYALFIPSAENYFILGWIFCDCTYRYSRYDRCNGRGIFLPVIFLFTCCLLDSRNFGCHVYLGRAFYTDEVWTTMVRTWQRFEKGNHYWDKFCR